VVVVSMSDAESALGIEALEAGALDVIHKPTAHATDRLYEMGQELREKVLGAAQARALPLRAPLPAQVPLPLPSPASARRGTGLVVIGTSTGGPQALTRLLSGLPGDLPVPVVIASRTSWSSR
jgi:two-component system chemotaxis response regulator CheB